MTKKYKIKILHVQFVIMSNMESKKDRTIRLLKSNPGLLNCPICTAALDLNDDDSLRCINGHSFDISKKGIINLTGKGNDKLYNSELFTNRRAVITSGSYKPLIDKIAEVIYQHAPVDNSSLRILDAGCGEGSFLAQITAILYEQSNAKALSSEYKGLSMGMDLSKDGINLATDHNSDIIWLMGDLANMHIADSSFDVILNILSPANYNEFKRVLKDNGMVIKVIPGKKYLNEIRAIMADQSSEENQGYDNKETFEHTSKEMNIIHHERIEYYLRLSSSEFENFTNMTPMTHSKRTDSSKRREVCGISSPTEKAYGLTIDLEVFVGRLY